MSLPEVDVWRQIQDGSPPTADGVARAAGSLRARLGAQGTASLQAELAHSVLGLGPLAPLVEDDRVTDVLVNGTAGVWVDRGDGLQRVVVELAGESAVRRLAVRLAGLAGQRLDDANPCVDGLLPQGIRLHAVLPPLAEGGTHLSLRVPRRAVLDLDALYAGGLVDEVGYGVLRGIVRARLAFVVTGGTGTGKTTVLGALLAHVRDSERIVVVEDVRELAVDHPHVVRLQGRGSNVEGRGEITLTQLVRQSLRMRPDRLVIGEVRGAEVRELLGALNTGHEGGCGTLHANAAADVVSRFEALGALAGMPPAAVHTQLASALDVVVHLRRSGSLRVLGEIAVVERGTDGARVGVTPALCHRAGSGSWVTGPAWDRLRRLIDASAGEDRR